MSTLIILLVLLGVIGFAVMYGVGIYNRLVKLKVLVEEAWSGIDVQLKKRHDLIPNLIETVKGYATHEKETFQNVTEARNQAVAAKTVGEQQAAENKLNSSLMNLFAVAEQYPDLKANTNFMQLQDELTSLEADIEKSRRYYNGTVRDKNILIDTFPSNIVANIFGFVKSAFFELDNLEERAVPKVSF